MNHVSKELNIGRAGQYLVLFDLLKRGVSAYQTAEGMNYDIVADVEGRLIKLQVKTTQKSRLHTKDSKNPVYLYHVRRAGKNGTRMYQVGEFDGFALVALDIKEVSYLPFFDKTKSSIILRDKNISYVRKDKRGVRRGLYYQDLTWEAYCDVIRKRYSQFETAK